MHFNNSQVISPVSTILSIHYTYYTTTTCPGAPFLQILFLKHTQLLP